MGTYVPGSRLGLSALFTAFLVVSRLIREFGPRIRAAFPEADGLQSFLTALETAAGLYLAAKGEFDAANAPEGDDLPIDWDALPGRITA
jgi:hypothetical protein